MIARAAARRAGALPGATARPGPDLIHPERLNGQMKNRAILQNGRRAVAALLLATVWACESARVAAPDGALLAGGPPVIDPVDAQETTLRWLIDNRGAEGFDAYCVSTGYPDADNDPSADLLNRFAGNVPPVVPLSDCTISVNGDTYNPTGGPAQWFFVGDPAITGHTAEVQAGFHINGRLAEFYLCTLRLTGQGWRVHECELTGAA